MGEGEVSAHELEDVAEHFVLGVVGVEDGVGEVAGLAGEGGGDLSGSLRSEQRVDVFAGRTAEACEHLADVLARARFVKGDADAAISKVAEVDLVAAGEAQHACNSFALGRDSDGVEVLAWRNLVAQLLEARLARELHRANAQGDAAQALRPVITRVHPRDDREQGLRCTNVAGGLVAADVLFAGLDGHAQGGVALGVFADADDAAGHLADVFGLGRDERGVRAAEAHGDAEALRAADGDVGAEFARGRDERQGEQVGGHDDERADFVCRFDDGAVVFDASVGGGVLEDEAADVGREVFSEVRRGVDAELDT